MHFHALNTSFRPPRLLVQQAWLLTRYCFRMGPRSSSATTALWVPLLLIAAALSLLPAAAAESWCGASTADLQARFNTKNDGRVPFVAMRMGLLQLHAWCCWVRPLLASPCQTPLSDNSCGSERCMLSAFSLIPISSWHTHTLSSSVSFYTYICHRACTRCFALFSSDVRRWRVHYPGRPL